MTANTSASCRRSCGSGSRAVLQRNGRTGGSPVRNAFGASVGLAVATLSLFAPHLASAVVSGVASGVAAVAVQVSLWTRRAVHVLAMA